MWIVNSLSVHLSNKSVKYSINNIDWILSAFNPVSLALLLLTRQMKPKAMASVITSLWFFTQLTYQKKNNYSTWTVERHPGEVT